MNDRSHLLYLLVAIMATAAVFFPALDNGFTSWDDDVYLTENPLVRDLSLKNTETIFSSFVNGNYHPLAFVTYSLEHHFFGLNPRVYHATNLVLHLLVTALVFRLLTLFGVGLPAALAGTLLYSMHPMRVEAVAWVTARKDLLSALFFLGGLVAYLRYLDKGKRTFYTLSMLAFLLSLFAKATAVAFPVVLVLCDHLYRRVNKRSLVEKIPFFVLAAIFGVVALFARSAFQEVLQESNTYSEQIFMGVYRFVCTFLARTVWPTASFLPYYHLPPEDLTSPLFLLLASVCALCAAGILYSLKYSRRVIFGGFFFLVTVIPSLTVSVLGYSADRFMYLPSVGLSCLAALLIQYLWEWRFGGTAAVRILLAITLALMAGYLGSLTRVQCGVWRDSVTLWSDAVRSYPEIEGLSMNRAYAYFYRGRAFREKGELDRSLNDMTRAVELYPGKAQFVFNRGSLRLAMGRPRGAIDDFSMILRDDPRNVRSLNERGIAYMEIGEGGKALDDFLAAQRVDPENIVLSVNLGKVMLEQGHMDGAIEQFTGALRQDPSNRIALLGRARAAYAVGSIRQAWTDLLRAGELGYEVDPRFRSMVRGKIAAPP